MPLAIDLFCGLGGWTEGLLAEGWNVIGFDIERHMYPARALTDSEAVKGMSGTNKNGTTHMNYENERRLRNAPLTGNMHSYPSQLVLMDVCQIHGAMFKDADLIVASPPCQEFSYRAMPWKRAKALPPPLLGTNLFWQCWRIQHEACEAAGRYIPMVVENVRGAQKWVGRAQAEYGSFMLWGDVRRIGRRIVKAEQPRFGMEAVAAIKGQKHNPDGTQHGQGSWFKIADSKNRGSKNNGGSWFAIGSPGQTNVGQNPDGRKVQGFNFHQHENGKPGGSFQSAAVAQNGTKNARNWWSDGEGNLSATTSSHSKARKAASAQIAKIPFPLSSFIGRIFHP